MRNYQIFRLENFEQWMDRIEDKTKELDPKTLTPEQYKDIIAKFKVGGKCAAFCSKKKKKYFLDFVLK